MLTGVRIFTLDSEDVRSDVSQIFFSRRSEGPYYRWSFAEDQQKWRSMRVPHDQLPHLPLNAWSWRNIPHALQRSLVDHYQE